MFEVKREHDAQATGVIKWQRMNNNVVSTLASLDNHSILSPRNMAEVESCYIELVPEISCVLHSVCRNLVDEGSLRVNLKVVTGCSD